MIRVFHLLNSEMPSLVCVPFAIEDEGKRAKLARELFDARKYELVATLPETSSLEHAWRVTNNVDNSWSRDPAPGVTPAEPNHHRTADGRILGRRSSMVGDVFEQDGALHVVVRFGFQALPI